MVVPDDFRQVCFYISGKISETIAATTADTSVKGS